jgi:DNA invertase Pin-like site-specific DNA recombinase
MPDRELDELAEKNPGLARRQLVDLGASQGVQRQEAACRKIAADHGWEIVEVFKDDDRSAYSGKRRPGFEALLDAIKAGDVNAVVAWSPMRLIRNPRILEDFIDLLDAHRVEVATHMAGLYDVSTSGGRLVARVVGATAKHESEEKSERLRLKMAQKRDAGEWLGGSRPYGYEKDGVTPNPAEAAIVVEMVSRIAAGETLTGITVDLNARGVRTATGKRWSPANVRRTVLRPRYIGHAEHQGEDIGAAGWPALVDEATWRRAVHVFNSPERRRRRTARRYLLSGGVLLCGKCGTAMIAKPHHYPTGSVSGYSCPPKSNPKRGLPGGCQGVSILAEEVEEMISDQVFRKVESAAFAKALRRRSGVDRSAIKSINAIEAERDELAAAYGAGAISMREYKIARAAQDARLAAAEAQTLTDQTFSAVGRYAGRPGLLRAEWPAMTLDRKQSIVRSVIESVVIEPAKRGANSFDPSRVQPPKWRV